jgi:hypothetical protein
MPAPDRQPPTRTDSTSSWAYTKGLVGYYTDAEVDQLLANLPAGPVDLNGYAKTEDLPAVFEQDAEPTGCKDGDLWLAGVVAGPLVTREDIDAEVARAISQNPGLTEQQVVALVRKTMSGGKEVPPDINWTPTTNVAGSGLIEARLRNGQITLRGELVYTNSATGSYTDVRALPASFPKPDVAYQGILVGKELGVAFKPVAYQISTTGRLSICPIGGKITHVTLDGATAYV